jgi:hypothetical protein
MNVYPPPPGPGMMPPRPSVWKVLKTENGREYYHNTVLGTTSWEKPEELMTDEEASSTLVARINVFLTLIIARNHRHALDGTQT